MKKPIISVKISIGRIQNNIRLSKKEVEFMKKFLAVILSAVIIATVFPFSFSAFAAEDNDAQSVPASDVQEMQDATEATQPTQATEATEATEAPTTQPVTQAPTTQPATEAPTTQPATQAPTKAPAITPGKVSSFKVAKTSSSAVLLQWKLSANATRYVIQRSEISGKGTFDSYVTVKTTGASATSFKDTKLEDMIVYRYRIYAYRTANGVTTHSSAVSVTVMTKPNKIKKIVVKEKTTSAIKIKWSKVSYADKYYVYRASENSKGKMSAYKLYTKTKKTGIKDHELSSGTIYKYKVCALAKKGKYNSLSAGKAVKAMTKMDTPAKFITKSVGTKKIKLAWSKVPHAQKYELYRAGGGAKSKLIATLKTRRYSDTKISAGTDYVYKVRGIRVYKHKKYAGGYKTVSSSAGIKGLGSLTAKSFLNKALLAWSPVQGASGYEVYVKRSNGEWDSLTTTTNCAYFSNRLKTGKVYKFAVKPYKTIANTKVYGNSKKIAVKAKSGSLYGSTPSGTWVEVSIDTQMMFMYVNNKLYVSTPVVTGNIGDRSTSKGLHHVISKKSPARLHGSYGGSSWDTTVNYWLGFTSDGQGIHDATWRSAFGGSIYKGNGSHGCVNTPLGAVAKIYSKAYVGMPVIVY